MTRTNIRIYLYPKNDTNEYPNQYSDQKNIKYSNIRIYSSYSALNPPHLPASGGCSTVKLTEHCLQRRWGRGIGIFHPQIMRQIIAFLMKDPVQYVIDRG